MTDQFDKDAGQISARVGTWARAIDAMNRRLIANWQGVIRRSWSMLVAGIWVFIGSIILVAPMVSDEAKALIGVWPFAGGLLLASFSFGIARILKQPGTEDQ